MPIKPTNRIWSEDAARELGRYLRGARERGKLRQSDVAVRAGISTTSLSRLETGDRAVRVDVLARVADAAGADPGEAFRLAGQAPPQAMRELLGREIEGALDRGRLSTAAREVLRDLHLQRLAERLLAQQRAARAPVSVDDVLFHGLGVDMCDDGDGDVRLRNAETIEYAAAGGDPRESPSGRLALADIAGLVVLADGADPTAPGTRHRRADARRFAVHLLVPESLLKSELPGISQPWDVWDEEGCGGLVGDVARRFEVPPWVAMKQLSRPAMIEWLIGGSR